MLKKDLNDLDHTGQKGDWCFLNGEKLLALRYEEDPFKGLVILPIHPDIMRGQAHWQWNGDRDKPTLTPSILVHAYEGWTIGWHGFLRDGQLINA